MLKKKKQFNNEEDEDESVGEGKLELEEKKLLKKDEFDGYKKGEVLDMVDLGKGKTHGYSFIEKAQKAARELYNKKYRD